MTFLVVYGLIALAYGWFWFKNDTVGHSVVWSALWPFHIVIMFTIAFLMWYANKDQGKR
jgi:hypothetical protein